MRRAELVDVMNEIGHVQLYRLDRPNPSSWIVNTYPKSMAPWENGCMADGQFDFDSVRAALAREIRENGIAPTKLSETISKTNKSLVKNIMDEGKDIKLSTLSKLADRLDINVARLIPWARPEVSIPTEVIRGMMEDAMQELPVGATVADYLRSVPEALHERLGQFLERGAFPSTQDATSAPGKDAQPPAPTKPSAGA